MSLNINKVDFSYGMKSVFVINLERGIGSNEVTKENENGENRYYSQRHHREIVFLETDPYHPKLG